ncbi:MAG: hypothetical protein AB2L14_31005 [Candidatus Xenobiia bacterium LiM19]
MKEILAYLEKIDNMLDKARKMSPVEFEIQKTALAEQLKPQQDINESEAAR